MASVPKPQMIMQIPISPLEDSGGAGGVWYGAVERGILHCCRMSQVMTTESLEDRRITLILDIEGLYCRRTKGEYSASRLH